MKKPDALRSALQAVLPEFAGEPDRLRLWIEDGSAQSRQTDTAGFGFSYRLNLLLVEASTDIALIALPIFQWLRVNQPNLLAPGATGFSFDVDVLDNRACDILIQLELTENVSVAPNDDGGFALNYLAEPDPLFLDALPPGDLGTVPDLDRVTTEANPEAGW